MSNAGYILDGKHVHHSLVLRITKGFSLTGRSGFHQASCNYEENLMPCGALVKVAKVSFSEIAPIMYLRCRNHSGFADISRDDPVKPFLT
jgi:hypothetical protein